MYNWLQLAVTCSTGLAMLALGGSAYYRHRCESLKAVSMRTWMYWTYSVAFGAAAVAAVLDLCLTAVFPQRAESSIYLSLFAALLALSYVVFLAGVRRGTFR